MKIQEPNWRDQRTYNTVYRALGWAVARLRVDSDVSVSVEEIQRYLGKIYKNTAPRWLYHNLLVTTSSHYNHNTGKTKQYRLNAQTVAFLNDYLYLFEDGDYWDVMSNMIVSQWPRDFCHAHWQATTDANDYAQDILAGQIDLQCRQPTQRALDDHIWDLGAGQLETGEIIYQDKSHRLWNPLQNLQSHVKRDLLSQYQYHYHYDIRSAAPTLLVEHALQSHDLHIPALRKLIQDPVPLRDHIACNITTLASKKSPKKIINALVAGARLTHWRSSMIMAETQNNRQAVEWLSTDPEIQSLRRDIKTLWHALDPQLGPRKSITDRRGCRRRQPRTSREKWDLYFQVERRVLDQVQGLFRQQQARIFLEHDGWSSQRLIDPQEIQDHIRRQLGYRVTIKWEQHNDFND